jgi:dihydroorotase
MAAASLQQEQLIVTRPDDWHLHLRDGGVLCQQRRCSSSGNGD